MTNSIKERVYELLNNPTWYNYGLCCNCPNFNGGDHECTPSDNRRQCKRWRVIKNISKLTDNLIDTIDAAAWIDV